MYLFVSAAFRIDVNFLLCSKLRKSCVQVTRASKTSKWYFNNSGGARKDYLCIKPLVYTPASPLKIINYQVEKEKMTFAALGGGGGGGGVVPSGQSLQWWTDWAGSRREPKNKHCVSDLALKLKKRQKHTHTQNALLLRCQCETEGETEDVTLLDINWRLQLHSHHSSFYGPSGLIDGGFAVLVCSWALKLCLIQSGITFVVGDYLDYLLKLFFFYWCWPLWG